MYKPENVTALDQLKAQVWNESQKPYIISGEVGVLRSEHEDFRIHGASQVVSPDGYLFKTDNLEFDSNRHELTTEDPVEALPAIQRGDAFLKLSGRGLVIDVKKNSYDIQKNVHAEQHMSAGDFLTIHSRQAQISPTSRSALFLGSVQVKSPKLDMRGGRLIIYFSNEARPQGVPASRADKLVLDNPRSAFPSTKIEAQLPGLKLKSKGLTVELAPEGGVKRSEAIGKAEGVTPEGIQLKADTLISDQADDKTRILLKGDVHIQLTDERIATCQEAQYFPDSGEILLERVASVKRGQQILEGEKIRFSTHGSEIVVEKAKGQMDPSSIRAQPKAQNEGKSLIQ
jgi:lipopolysaccharide export system protein LptA